MSAISDRLHDVPDTRTYLNLVKTHLAADEVALQRFLSELNKWVELQRSRDYRSSSDASILRIAAILRFNPKLLHGFNTLLRPGQRLQLSTTVEEVKYFVLVEGANARIYSTSDVEMPSPSTAQDLHRIVVDKEAWKKLLDANPDKGWLVCISQLLQLIVDFPSEYPGSGIRAYRCLHELAADSILPPSIFVNILKRGPTPAHEDGGAFADIFKADVNGMSVCFRVLRMFKTNVNDRDQLYKDFCSEVLVWRQLKHPNILPFIGANVDLFSPRFCFISPWLYHGNIMSYLKQHPNHDRFASVCEIVEGIEYLHGLDPPVTHKDIKGANVLVRDDLVCCLADFGLSSILESQRLGRGSPAFDGSFCWAAPELKDPSRSLVKNEKAGDIYALACTIYEIYTGRPPLYDIHTTTAAIMFAVLRGSRPTLPPPGDWTEGEELLWWLVGLCWKDRPEDRPEICLIKQTLRDIGAPKSQAAQTLSTQAEDRVFTPDLEEVLDWLDEESRSEMHISPQQAEIVDRSAPDYRHDGLPHLIDRTSRIEQGWTYEQTVRKVNYPGSFSQGGDRKNVLQPAVVPPPADSLGLLTPNTPSHPLLDVELQEDIQPDNEPSTSDRHPTAQIDLDSRSSLPTPPTTPLPTSPTTARSPIRDTNNDRHAWSTRSLSIPPPRVQFGSRPLDTKPPSNFPVHLRRRERVFDPKLHPPNKPFVNNQGTTSYTHASSPLRRSIPLSNLGPNASIAGATSDSTQGHFSPLAREPNFSSSARPYDRA